MRLIARKIDEERNENSGHPMCIAEGRWDGRCTLNSANIGYVERRPKYKLAGDQELQYLREVNFGWPEDESSSVTFEKMAAVRPVRRQQIHLGRGKMRLDGCDVLRLVSIQRKLI
mgnify:FL=1